MADRIKGITIEIGGDTTKLSESLKGVNQDLRAAQNGLKDVNKLLKMDPSNVELLRQKQGYLNDAIKDTKEKLEKEKEALEQLKNSDGFDKNSEQAKALERQIAADEQQLKSLKEESRQFGSVASQQFKAVGEKVKEVGDKISGVGKQMSMKVTAPIVAVGAASVKAFKEVDAGMDIVSQKTGASGKALEEMQRNVENLATSIPTDFETAGTAIGEVNTRFQLTGQALEDLSGQYIKFAQINNTDVTSAIDQSQKALTAFGLGAEEAGGLLDTLNFVGQQTGASMDTLLSGLVNNSAAFTEMGLSIDQAVAFMGQMEVSGADASAVMGGLSRALKNATEEGIPLDQALAQLQNEILNGTESTDGLTAAYDLFGKSGAQVFEAVKNGSLDFTNLASASLDAGDSVSKTFNNTKDPIDDWTTAMNKAKVAGAELGSVIQTTAAPLVEKLSGYINNLTEKFRALTPEQQTTIVKIGAIVAAIGPALLIIGKLVAGVQSVISILGVVIGVMGGPLTLAISGVIAAGVLLYKNWDTVKEKASALWTSLKNTFEQIKTTIGNAIEKIKSFFDFEWHFPHLALPHFSLEGSFSLNPPSVPHLAVSWYKKAYENGVMFTHPTVLQTPSGYKGFGDGNGAEVVLGLNKLRELAGAGETNIQINVYGAEGQNVNQLAAEIERRLVKMQNQRTAVWA